MKDKQYISLKFALDIVNMLEHLTLLIEGTDEYDLLVKNIELRKTKSLLMNSNSYNEIKLLKEKGTLRKDLKYVNVLQLQVLIYLMECRQYYIENWTPYYGKYEKYDRKVKRTVDWLIRNAKI